MQRADWATLGIEPTRDLIAIKKAYAARLKVTRPDDDAQAYQALRDAYARVQRWVAEPPTPAPRPGAVVPTPVRARPPEAPEPTKTPVLPEPWKLPVPPASDLVEQVEALWQQGGNGGLRRAWPQVLAQLRARPETLRAQDAVQFAQWLVASEGLPTLVRRGLQLHFGWQRDYRLARSLGDELAEALLARLEDLDDEPAEAVSRHPLAELHAMWRTPGQRGRALWIAVCGQPYWLRLLSRSGGSRKLRLDARQAFSLRLLLTVAALPRLIALAAALALPGMAFIGDPAAVALPLFVLAWPMHVLLRGVLWLGGAALLWDLSLLAGGGLDEEGWRIHPVRLGLALAALIGAVALAAMPAEGRPGEIAHGLGLMALGASVLIVRWTQLLSRSPAVVGCFIAAWLLCRWGLAAQLAPVGPAALAAAWVLLGTAAHEGRLGHSPAVRLAEACTWPVSRTLALADRWGWRFTYWPSACVAVMAAGAAATERMPWLACALAVLWAAWTAALLATQAWLDHGAQATLAPPPTDRF